VKTLEDYLNELCWRVSVASIHYPSKMSAICENKNLCKGIRRCEHHVGDAWDCLSLYVHK
jgi:hypothetical protein